MNLKKIGKLLTNKSVGTGSLSYEKIIYRATVSQRLRNTVLHCTSEDGFLSVTFLRICRTPEHNSVLSYSDLI